MKLFRAVAPFGLAFILKLTLAWSGSPLAAHAAPAERLDAGPAVASHPPAAR